MDCDQPSFPTWTSDFPDPRRLRSEARLGADTFIDAIRAVTPPEDIAGIYVKGSSLKHWDSPLDYVPVVSDVDIHLLFTDDDAMARFDQLDVAFRLSREAEQRYLAAVSDPIHIPRVQLMLANDLFRQPDFVPSPIETVETRFGLPYPSRAVAPANAKEIAIARTMDHQAYLNGLPHTMADLTGPHLRRVLRDLSWKVAPTAPRLLELAGVDFHTCWTSNRSRLTQLLEAQGMPQMARAYRDFYVFAWEYFLSSDRDGEPARAAIAAAYELLSLSITCIQTGQPHTGSIADAATDSPPS